MNEISGLCLWTLDMLCFQILQQCSGNCFSPKRDSWNDDVSWSGFLYKGYSGFPGFSPVSWGKGRRQMRAPLSFGGRNEGYAMASLMMSHGQNLDTKSSFIINKYMSCSHSSGWLCGPVCCVPVPEWKVLYDDALTTGSQPQVSLWLTKINSYFVLGFFTYSVFACIFICNVY